MTSNYHKRVHVEDTLSESSRLKSHPCSYQLLDKPFLFSETAGLKEPLNKRNKGGRLTHAQPPVHSLRGGRWEHCCSWPYVGAGAGSSRTSRSTSAPRGGDTHMPNRRSTVYVEGGGNTVAHGLMWVRERGRQFTAGARVTGAGTQSNINVGSNSGRQSGRKK